MDGHQPASVQASSINGVAQAQAPSTLVFLLPTTRRRCGGQMRRRDGEPIRSAEWCAIASIGQHVR